MERFLDPEVLGFALDNPNAEVREMALPQLALRARRHEASTHQPVPPQIADPLRIGHVGLAPRHGFGVVRVHHQRFDPRALEHVVDRPPVNARGFHRHDRHRLFLEPVRGQASLASGGKAARGSRSRACALPKIVGALLVAQRGNFQEKCGSGKVFAVLAQVLFANDEPVELGAAPGVEGVAG